MAQSARIAQAYLQIIPLLDANFTKKIAQTLDKITKAVDFSDISDALENAVTLDAKELEKKTRKAMKGATKAVTDEMDETGKVAGKELMKSIDEGIGNKIPEVNTRGVIQEADRHGGDAGKALKRAMNTAIGNSAPDVNSRAIVGEAGADGKAAGKKLVDEFTSQIAGANPPALPTPASNPAGAAQAGAQAGQTYASAFQDSLTGMIDNAVGLVGGAAAIGIAGKGLAAAKTWEAGHKEIAASLALTEAQAEQANAVIRTLYNENYGESMEMVEAATESVLAGMDMIGASEKELEGVTRKILTLQQAFEIDPTRVTDIAGQMVKTGMAKDADEAVTLFTAAMQKVPISSREALVDAMDEYSDYIDGLGLTGSKGMEMLIKMSEKGAIGIDKGSDALKEASILMTDLSSATQDTYAAMGLDGKQMANDILAGGDAADKAFTTIVSKLLTIKDPAEQAQAAIALFGSPLEDLGKQNIPAFLNSISSVPGALGDIDASAAELHDQMRDTFETPWGQAVRTWETTMADAFLPILEAIIPYLEKFADWVNENRDAIIKWTPWVLGAVAVIGGLMAIGGVVLAFSAFGGILATIAGAIGSFIIPALAVITIAAGIGVAIWAVIQWFNDFDGVLRSTGEMMLWIYDAMGWVGDVAYFLGAGFVNFFVGLWNGLKWILNGIMNVTDDLLNIPIFEKLFGNFEMSAYADWTMPEMATGGDVTGPTALIAGEKDPETIVNRGVMNANLGKQNDLIDSILKNGTGTGMTNHFTIVQQPGQSPEDLTRMVIDRLDWESGR